MSMNWLASNIDSVAKTNIQFAEEENQSLTALSIHSAKLMGHNDASISRNQTQLHLGS